MKALDGGDARFRLDTRDLFPKWAEWVMYGGAALIGLVGGIGLTVQLNPAALLFVAFTAFFIWWTHKWVSGLRDPSKNYVALGRNDLRVVIYQPIRPWRVKFKYASLDKIEKDIKHGYSLGLRWPMMYGGWGDPHVDVHLKRGRPLISSVGGIIPWLKVVHLRLEDPGGFVAALTARFNAAH